MKNSKHLLVSMLILSAILLGACNLATGESDENAAATAIAGTAAAIFTHAAETAAPPALLTPTPASTEESVLSVEEQLNQIDQALNQFLLGNIAYNVPERMRVDEIITLELLLNPSAPQEELSEQISAKGEVESAIIEITPRMKVELRAEDAEAFEIQAIHDNAEQLIGSTHTTRWAWLVKAKKEGTQNLILTVYRLIKYEEVKDWREVKSYQTDIAVEITLGQRIKSLDWKWVIPTIITAILIPALWRWTDNKKRAGIS
ncbi:MAG: hypothetical protein HN390_04135 [Anaerolineae bacterium]|nr:hypothetical protein [Anaerolineae bacterium]MBT7192221.1 hypothetical protein [Anaerolineae bacterium]MBT7989632.1 hypothetical protein [Anaerolineae bacterium]